MDERRSARGRSWALGAAGAAGAVALWWLFTRAAGAEDPLLAAFRPEKIPAALGELISRGVLLPDIGVSLLRLGLGLVLAVVVGLPLGLWFGSSRTAEQVAHPVVQFLRMVSPLSWAPVAVALLGVGHAPVVFLVAVAAVWPVVLGTSAGVRAVDPGHLRVAESLGATRAERLRHVVLPSIRPHVLTGVRTALGIGWVILVPAEMLGVSSGLGYEILNARDRLAYDEMLAVILVIGLLGTVLDAAARMLLRARA
ncbi:ABC transporter permease [Rothia kristinae]|uniref:ABC transporter permease n=1 Tax=Rothia kristinae TaxID=37923 RepID=A0A7T3F8M1_9MICC|nr:ABC transporter permease [Rothia kristinae]MED6047213.1 ABC transporter permease [Rothia kristinae]QPT54178.1 ABC transporter permease [Rothia kristinae]TDP54673.1 NitT/TauT family transport system permease protein [Kocuria sp. AG109]